MRQPIPIILDTDIGTDIDDAWALALLLRSPEVELRLIVTSGGNPLYRAGIIAGMLLAAGRTDIPIGLGRGSQGPSAVESVPEFAGAVALEHYPGRIVADGIGEAVGIIGQSPLPVTLLAIAPLTNIREILRRCPEAAAKTDFIGMHGSFLQGQGERAEWNILMDISAARSVLSTAWRSATIAPLDVCATAVISGMAYRDLLQSSDPLLRALFRQYELWHAFVHSGWEWRERSSILYDVVAAWMVFSRESWHFRTHGIRVDDTGKTWPDDSAPPVSVAVRWLARESWFEAVAARLNPVFPGVISFLDCRSIPAGR